MNEYRIGQKVRATGSTLIATGAEGTITGIHAALGCPVVYFPTGVHGPHSTFAILNPAQDLQDSSR